jgi:hypothetical protein
MNRFFIALIATLSTSAYAEFLSGNDLYERMISKDGTRQAFAMAYVAGAHDAMFGVSHCTPDNVTIGQVHDLVKAALEKFPADRHHSADQFVVLTLKGAFPCANKPTSQRSNI